MSRRGRWPGWVFSTGDEPDYRFSFANERTFLAWIRTALALLAAGVAVDTLSLSIPSRLQTLLAFLLVGLGLLCALASWFRWAKAERAMRHREPLPGSSVSAMLTSLLVLAAAALLVTAF